MAGLAVCGEVAWLHRGVHAFVRAHAARAWVHEDNGQRWEIMLPPGVAALPAHKRYRALAPWLYDVDAEVTARAAALGALSATAATARRSCWPGIPPRPGRLLRVTAMNG
jgi:hypothetical protein